MYRQPAQNTVAAGMLPSAKKNQEAKPEEPEPFFVFDRSYIDHDACVDPDGFEDEKTSNSKSRVPPSRRLDEFCSIKCGPSCYPHRDRGRFIPTCCVYCLPKSKVFISERSKEKGIENCLVVNAEEDIKTNWFTKWIPGVIFNFWKISNIVTEHNNVTCGHIENDKDLLKTFVGFEDFNQEKQLTLKSSILSFINQVCIPQVNRLRFLLSFWATRIFFKCMFGSVFVHIGEIDQLKTTQNKGLPIIFLPVYRGVLDPILLSWVLTRYSIRPPFQFEGYSMNDTLLKKLMSHSGLGIAIKEQGQSSESCDMVRAGISSYLRILLKRNNNCEIVVEPCRSKNGLPSTYLYGSELVRILIELFQSKELEDAYIVPVCTSYERLPEEDEYLQEFKVYGQKTKTPSYLNLFWNGFRRPAGNVRVDFGQPFSLREFEREVNSTMKWAEKSAGDNGYCLTIRSTELQWNEDGCSASSLPLFYKYLEYIYDSTSRFVDLLAYHAIYDGSNCGAIMCTHVLALFIVKKYPKGVEFDLLEKEFENFQLPFRMKDRDFGFKGSMQDAILRAIHVLGPSLVSVEVVNNKRFVKAVPNKEGKLLLGYYANHVVSGFANEVIFATTLFSLCEKSITAPTFLIESVILIPMREFAHAFRQVYKLLKTGFFIHPPCQNSDDAINTCIDIFQNLGYIGVIEKKKYRDQIEEDEDYWDSDPGDRFQFSNDFVSVILNKRNIENLTFWKNLTVGYFEVYRTCCLQLFSMLPNRELEEIKMLDQMLALSLRHARQNICGDVLCISTIKNFVNRMIDLEVMHYYSEQNNTQRYFYLADKFSTSPAIEILYDILDRHVFYP